MKNFGYILMAVGLALLIFMAINLFKEKNQIKSPVPLNDGVKVIFVTPSTK